MRRLFVLYLLAVLSICSLASRSSFADIQPPSRTLAPVSDPTLVVNDRGAKLEVLATQRATPQTDAAGRPMAHHITITSASAPMGPRNLGVVFNHAMQAQGYISGEITFQVKSGKTLPALDPVSYPGLKRITKPEVYAVVARTPAEFITVLKRLQARTDLKWVEPTVTYGPYDAPNSLR